MAINTLTDLANDIQLAKQIVGRERIGGTMAIMNNSDDSTRAAKGDIIRSLYAPEPVVNTTYSPSMTIPEGDAQTFTNETMTLNNFINVQIPWDGEEQRHLDNGAGYESARGLQIEQAFRKLANQADSDLMAQIVLEAGNAVGTAGSAPFGTNFDLIADAMKELDDRGAPMGFGDISLVLGNQDVADLRKIDALWQVNTSGREDLLRRGVIGELYGALLRADANTPSVAKGTENGAYLVNNGAGYSAGDKSIAIDTGSGTILAGNVVSFGASPEHKYVVAADLSGPGTLTLNSGLLEDVADNAAVTVDATHRADLLIHRNAAEMAFRPIVVPRNGDAAIDRMTVRDDVSGLVFELALYQGYYKTMLDISVLYGYKVWNPDFACVVQA
jgi:hypothetical protein